MPVIETDHWIGYLIAGAALLAALWVFQKSRSAMREAEAERREWHIRIGKLEEEKSVLERQLAASRKINPDDQIKQIVGSMNILYDIQSSGNDLTARFKDKDGDAVHVFLNFIDDERLVMGMPLRVPPDRMLASLVATSAWNLRTDAHGTIASVAGHDDVLFVMLGSHLSLKSGVSEDNFKAWVNNFVRNINSFEEQIVSTLNEVGEDSAMLRSGGGSGFWGTVGEFTGGLLGGLVGQMSDDGYDY
jgi:hypothetical protein